MATSSFLMLNRNFLVLSTTASVSSSIFLLLFGFPDTYSSSL
jgi:hypothetical protein